MHIKKPQKAIFIINFMAVLMLAYGLINEYASMVIVLLILLNSIRQNLKTSLITTMFFYPFMFLLRVPNHENLLFIIFSDILCNISIIKYLNLNIKYKTKDLIYYNYLSLLIVIIFSAIITINNFLSLLFLYRQIIMPLIMFIIIYTIVKKDNQFLDEISNAAMIPYVLISIMVILNYLNLMLIPPVYEATYPTINYLRELDNPEFISRKIIFGLDIQRSNLMIGGAGGSVAAIFVAIGIFVLHRNDLSKFKRYFYFGVLTVAAILSGSFSLIIPWLIYLAIKITKRLNLVISIPIIILLFLLITTNLGTTQFDILSYFFNSYVANIFDNFSNFSLNEIIFGKGITIQSSVIIDESNDFLAVDVGIFKLLFEFGAIVFIIFMSLILIAFIRYYNFTKNNNNGDQFLVLVITMLVSIHTYLPFLAPFFCLFAVCFSGLSAKQDVKI